VELIRLDADTQSREGVSVELVEEYATAWLHGAKFPPLEVFQGSDGDFYLADGFHRYLAAKKVAKASVPCRVFVGSARDAFLFACTTNQAHGMRRTNADKRYMVSRLLSDPEWVNWTDSRIAEQCGVSHTFVASMRREFETVANSPAARARTGRRSGSDGKSYPAERRIVRVPLEIRPEQESKDDDPEERNRARALTALDQVKRWLKTLDLYGRHMTALEAIEHDLQRS
jgi:hypothetical protein